MSKEIERKFLIKKLAKGIKKGKTKVDIEQFYTVIMHAFEERMRKATTNGVTVYTCTTKTGNGLIREEKETETDSASWEDNRARKVGNLIKKTRYLIPWGNYTGELDVYESPENLCTLEIEFPNEFEAKRFTIDRYSAIGEVKEVTGNKSYSNKNLAQNGGEFI